MENGEEYRCDGLEGTTITGWDNYFERGGIYKAITEADDQIRLEMKKHDGLKLLVKINETPIEIWVQKSQFKQIN
jgi:hypothetical protein